MKENSIKEDIILLKDFTEGNFKRDKLENYKGSYKMGYFYYKDIQQAIERVLSDYTRVLKEIEELKETLKCTQNSWYEDTQKIEEMKKQIDLDNECEIALNSKVMDLEKEIEELTLDLEEMTKSNNHKKENWVHKNILNSYVSKDKIKAKIEEVKDGTYDAKIILESLLEKK